MPPKKRKVSKKPGKARKKLSAKEIARKEAVAEEMRKLGIVKDAEYTTTDAGKRVVKDVWAGVSKYGYGKFNKEGLDVDITFADPSTMEKTTIDWCLSLVRRNLRKQYIAARWGWADGEKRKELEDSHARYLICRAAGGSAASGSASSSSGSAGSPAEESESASSSTGGGDGGGEEGEGGSGSGDEDKDDDGKEAVVSDSKGELLAFVHFRFMLEGDDPVLYVFEIQSERRARGKGLGSHLMKGLEMVAFLEGMQHVVLTVFTENEGARRFYQNLKYAPDELSLSPAMLGARPAYQILSKCVDPKRAKEKRTRHKALQDKIHGERAPSEAFRTLALAAQTSDGGEAAPEAEAAAAAAAEGEEDGREGDKAATAAE